MNVKQTIETALSNNGSEISVCENPNSQKRIRVHTSIYFESFDELERIQSGLAHAIACIGSALQLETTINPFYIGIALESIGFVQRELNESGAYVAMNELTKQFY